MFNITKTLKAAALAATCLLSLTTQAQPAKGWFAVSDEIAEASYRTGVRVELLTAMAAIESTFNFEAKAKGSSARGMFQFTKRTWRTTVQQYGGKYGIDMSSDIHDPLVNAIMGAEYIKENIRVMAPRLGRTPTYSEVYMAHLLSPLKAVKMIKSASDDKARKVTPGAAKYNYNLFYSVSGVSFTVREFKHLLNTKISKALKIYGKLAQYALVAYKDETIALAKLDDLLISTKDVLCNVDPRDVMAVKFVGSDLSIADTELLNTDFLPANIDLDVDMNIREEDLICGSHVE